jgi:predicted RNA-binding Zn-ribbon protein involved in translation (DUF1610 family)
MIQIIETGRAVSHEAGIADLIKQMMEGKIEEISPVIDISRDAGVAYPQVELMLGKPPGEVIRILESLAAENVLSARFYDRLIFCPGCNSMNLRPSIRCPKCASGNIARGRIIEHLVCGKNGLEEEFMIGGKYICPHCSKPLKFLGTDYRSLGVNYKCHNCGVLSSDIALRWQCLKCSVVFLDEEAKIQTANAYVVNEQGRNRIAFDMGFKARFVEFLKLQGYEVFEMAKVTSKAGSGAAHLLDILARRNDGFITFLIGIGVAIGRDSDDVSLEDVFRFDNKVYDLGIHDKVLLAMPSINSEARQFARRQRIKAFDEHDLKEFIEGTGSLPPHPVAEISFKYESKSRLLAYLRKQGYRTEENASIPGRSGAEYNLDIIAYFDDGLFTHTISIGILADEKEVSLAAVSAYDTKAYDIGIHDKILLVCPTLSDGARQFAGQQKIKVIEVSDAASLNS